MINKQIKHNITQKYLKSISETEWKKMALELEFYYLKLIDGNTVFDSFINDKLHDLSRKISIQIKNDILNDREGMEISDCALHVPRKSSKYSKKNLPINICHLISDSIKNELIKCNEKEIASLGYSKIIAQLSKKIVQNRIDDNNKKIYKTCSIKNYGPNKISDEISNPLPMPVVVPNFDEFEPIFHFMFQNTNIDPNYLSDANMKSHEYIIDGQKGKCCIFKRGALYIDGRMDLCKQVVGPLHIDKLMQSLVHNTQISHFLLGNNIIGNKGCESIKNFLINDHKPQIETWYLAGNCIDDNGLEQIVYGLINENINLHEENKIVKRSLWLKRNPLYSYGCKSLAKLLINLDNLQLLDLNNTAIGLNKHKEPTIEGMVDLCNGLKKNNSLRYLYLSANGLNKDTIMPLVDYFKSIDRQGITSLWVDMNDLNNDGIMFLLDSLQNYQWIQRLSIGSNGMNHIPMGKLLESLSNKKLISLDLGAYKSSHDMGVSMNSIGDEGGYILCDFISKNLNLHYLGFNDNGLSDECYSQIIKTILNTDNQLIQISHNKLMTHGNELCDELLSKLKSKLEQNKINSKYNQKTCRQMRHFDDIFTIDSIYRNNDKQLW